MKRLFLLWVCAIGSMMSWAYTPQSVPQPWLHGHSKYVCNPDGILSAEDEHSIVTIAEKLHDIVGVEMATVVLEDIEDADAMEFSVELFNLWGIGNKQNQGVLILFALHSRDIQIRTGGGVEGLLPDAVCEQVLQAEMIPLLSDGDYGKGLLAGNRAIARLLTTDAAQAELLLGYQPKEVTEQPYMGLSICCLMLIGLILLMYFMRTKCPQCGKRQVTAKDQIVTRATLLKEGQGIKTFTCACCHHQWQQPYSIPRRVRTHMVSGGTMGGGFSGGGFSGGGFGGGMTFGGGAGGKF